MTLSIEQKHIHKKISRTEKCIKGNDIATLSNPNNKSFDKYDSCRVFFSFTDMHDFALERTDATVADMSIIIKRIENLPALREILHQYKTIYSYQTRVFRGQRFVWAHGYTEEKIDAFLAEFRHDHDDLLAWQPDKEPLSISGKEVLM